MHPRLDGADRDLEDLGGLGEPVLFEVDKHEDRTVCFRQARDGFLNPPLLVAEKELMVRLCGGRGARDFPVRLLCG